MKYPLNEDYQTAVKYCERFVLDPVLKKGHPIKSKFGLLMYSGGYTRVFPIFVDSEKYALRCWTADIDNAEYRYKCIRQYLENCHLPYFVSFDYITSGILVKGKTYPILRMEWAEGDNLKEFVQNNLNNPKILLTAADAFLKMTKDLHSHNIAHGDLQHENIIVQTSQNDIQLILIDYDSLYIPDFFDMPEQIFGLPSFQHPIRFTKGHQSKAPEKNDYFSEIVIYLSLLAFAENPDLWDIFQVETADGLIFTEDDFKNPMNSKVFYNLGQLSQSICILLDLLKSYCNQSNIQFFLPIEQLIFGTDNSLKTISSNIDRFSKTIPVPKKKYVPKMINTNVDQLIKKIKQYSPPQTAKDKTVSERGIDKLIQNIKSL